MSLEKKPEKPTQQEVVKLPEITREINIVVNPGDIISEPAVSLPSPNDQLRSLRLSNYDSMLQKEPYSYTLWEEYLGDALKEGGDVALHAFDKATTTFPTNGYFWLIYLKLLGTDHVQIGKLFSRCLVQCKDIKLWNFYIEETKRVNKDNTELILQGYHFAIEHFGKHFKSAPLWFATERLRLQKIREIYRTAISLPIEAVDVLSQDYNDWELSVSPDSVSVLNELNRRAAEVISCAQQLGLLYRGLCEAPKLPDNTTTEKVAKWKALLAYEEGNPLGLEKRVLDERVLFVYETCLVEMYFFPEMWYQYIRLGGGFSIERCERSIAALPQNVLLRCIYADALAKISTEEYAKAKDSLQKAAEEQKEPLLWINLIRFVRKYEGVKKARKIFLHVRKQPFCTYHIFLAEAHLEYWNNGDREVATRVLDSGMELFGGIKEYVDATLEMGMMVTEEAPATVMRALFEKLLKTVHEELKESIWRKYLDFEYSIGDQTMLSQLVERRRAIKPISDFQNEIYKYRFRDLFPCDCCYNQQNEDTPLTLVKPDLNNYLLFIPTEAQATSAAYEPPMKRQRDDSSWQ